MLFVSCVLSLYLSSWFFLCLLDTLLLSIVQYKLLFPSLSVDDTFNTRSSSSLLLSMFPRLRVERSVNGENGLMHRNSSKDHWSGLHFRLYQQSELKYPKKGIKVSLHLCQWPQGQGSLSTLTSVPLVPDHDLPSLVLGPAPGSPFFSRPSQTWTLRFSVGWKFLVNTQELWELHLESSWSSVIVGEGFVSLLFSSLVGKWFHLLIFSFAWWSLAPATPAATEQVSFLCHLSGGWCCFWWGASSRCSGGRPAREASHLSFLSLGVQCTVSQIQLDYKFGEWWVKG